MRKFKIKVKCTQELTFEMDEEAYGAEDEMHPVVSAEQIAEMEEQNVLQDPTYFDTWEDSTINVEVDVEEVKDA